MSPTPTTSKNYVTRFMVSPPRFNVKRSGASNAKRFFVECYRRARTAQRHIRALHHIEHVPTQQLETGCLRVSNAPHEQCKDANTSYQHRNSYRVVIRHRTNLHVTLTTICPHMALTEIIDAPAQRAL